MYGSFLPARYDPTRTNRFCRPQQSPPLPLQLTALLKATGISALNQIGWLRVTGEDRVRWLNGMVTNSIQH